MSNSYYNTVSYNDNIICPYCGTEYKPSYEDTFIGHDQVDCYTEEEHKYVCDRCGKQFKMWGSLCWEYNTETIDGEMTEEEHDNL